MPLYLLLIIGFLGGVLPSGSAASASYQALLDEAEQSRTGDPALFNDQLQELQRRIDEATPSQVELLDYLQAYQIARKGQFHEAIGKLRELHEQASDPHVRYRSVVFLANTLTAIRDYTEALRALEASLVLLPEVRDRSLRNQGMLTTSQVYNLVGQHELALDQSNRVLESHPAPRELCGANIVLLDSRRRLGITDSRERLEAAIRQCEASAQMLFAGFLHIQLAQGMSDAGERAEAIAHLEAIKPRIEATQYPRLISEVESLLAQNHLALGNHEQAEAHAIRATEMGASASNTEQVVAAHLALYEVAMHRGDTAAALEHHRRYAEAERAYMDNVKARELAFQIVNHETLQKNQTIELLNRRNQVLQLEQQVARQTATNQRLMMAILILLLASIAYWAYKVKRLQVSFRQLSETDTLTGLSNRRHFQREAAHLLTEGQRTSTPKSVILLDLDFFKRVNDQYGHASGDWVLRRVGEECRAIVRSGDLVSRLGGEEFVLFLRACPLAAALDLAERCRQRIEAIDTRDTGHHFRITASFGVADTSHAGHDLTALLEQADAALYVAKGDGRNRVATNDAVIDPDAPLGDEPPCRSAGDAGLRIVSG